MKNCIWKLLVCCRRAAVSRSNTQSISSRRPCHLLAFSSRRSGSPSTRRKADCFSVRPCCPGVLAPPPGATPDDQTSTAVDGKCYFVALFLRQCLHDAVRGTLCPAPNSGLLRQCAPVHRTDKAAPFLYCQLYEVCWKLPPVCCVCGSRYSETDLDPRLDWNTNRTCPIQRRQTEV